MPTPEAPSTQRGNSECDVERFLSGNRSLPVQRRAGGLARCTAGTAGIYAYRLPSTSLERYERANGY